MGIAAEAIGALTDRMRSLARRRVTLGLRVTDGIMPLLITVVVGFSLAGYLSLFNANYCDFRAFYCSGKVILSGGDPYREHPLHECEHGLSSRLLSTLPDEITIPAPYPGYALILFSAVARLPFDAAIFVWTLGSCIALAGAIVLVARCTATPFYATVIALAFPAVVIPLPLGQPTLFVLLSLAACAALLRSSAPRLAALAALTTAIDPHVGVALCLGLFVAVPQSRLILLGGAIALPALSTIVFGPAREWEYFHDVLPAHAFVNVPEFSQFSVANLAFTAGIAQRPALTIGNVWYLGSVVVGVLLGLRLRSRLGIASVTFIPVAFAVFGGAHTHLQQLGLAIPAFLLVSSATGGSLRTILTAATFVASVPWLLAAPFPYLFLAVAVLAIAFARLMGRPRIALALGAGCFVLLVLLCFIVVHSHPASTAVALPTRGNPLAEVAWGAFVRASFLPAQEWYLAAKIPTLVSFLIIFGVLFNQARSGREAHPLGPQLETATGMVPPPSMNT